MVHPPSMALAKDPLPHGSCITSKLQASAFSEEEDSSESSNGVSKTSAGAMTLYSRLTAPSSVDGKGYISKGSNFQPEETESLFNFKAGCYAYDSVLHNSDSLYSFQQSSLIDNSNYMKINSQKDNHCVWGNGLNSDYQWTQVSPKYARLQQDFSCFQTTNSYCSIGYKVKENQPDQWLYSESTVVADTPHEVEAHEPTLHKRPSMEESIQAQKKQCSSHQSKKQKPKSTPSKDPQSIAAKNRRERISERLKILQELVPNGSKVDLVTMLEKAVSYVKFLQLQVKVLATDEFWPAQGGKAPDISQVKEAIDAILRSHNEDRDVTSK